MCRGKVAARRNRPLELLDRFGMLIGRCQSQPQVVGGFGKVRIEARRRARTTGRPLEVPYSAICFGQVSVKRRGIGF